MPDAPNAQPSSASAPAPGADYYERLSAALGDRYRIERRIGEGGMAAVFLAEDLKHHRPVAVKVLHESLTHTIGIKRFLQEIDVVARLQHPHLLTLIDSGDVGGLPYYVMPYLEAPSLREVMAAEKQLPVDRAVAIAREIADGLAFAHSHGVIHRDIKPSNILMSGGHAVVADFGIATALQRASEGRMTETGISLGSPTYMSPEQAAGERDLDQRTDVYSLACVLYEMLGGTPPLDDLPMQAMVTGKMTGAIARLRDRRPNVPPALEAAIHKGLSADRDARFPTMVEFSNTIADALPSRARVSRRIMWSGAAAAIAVLAAGALWLRQERRVVWATQQLGEIGRLATAGSFAAAFELSEAVEPIIPHDSTLQRLRPTFTDYLRIVTVPPGARVSRQRLDRPESPWEVVGVTPLDSVPMPKYGFDLTYRLRIERDGNDPAEILPNVFADWQVAQGILALDTLRLDSLSEAQGMARIPGFSLTDSLNGRPVRFRDYHIGRYEVTNQEYQRFVAAGGYQKPEYWTEPFVRDGRALTLEQAMAEFRDRTGLPGPATWDNGTFPSGQEDFPVGGVSWYEAAAYARFAGRQLPTSAHWARAAIRYAIGASWIYMPSSHFNASQPRRVGAGLMNPFGLYDVAGNVREWCANPAGEGMLTRGAAWEDGEFLTDKLIPKPSFDRSPSNGFRVAALSDPDSSIRKFAGNVDVRLAYNDSPPLDFRHVTPVSDAEFGAYRRMFDYDRAPLEARRDTSGVAGPYKWEKVSFTAAYGGERMAAYIFLGADAKPPYEPILYWPGSGAMTTRSFNPAGFGPLMGFVAQNGRAFVLPLYKGSYERDDNSFSTRISVPDSTTYFRDLAVQWIKDLRRTVDYLESRDDMRADRLGYVGYSWGSEIAPIALVLEPRIKAAVLNAAGFWPWGTPRPEVESVNFAPRVRTPVLVLSGRYDPTFPLETTALPFFQQLGTPASDKKHIIYSTGHGVPQDAMVRETLAWFDRYLSDKKPQPQP